jgi:peptidoglycan hydrolase-like protein with peptidoglycan-binding domain
MKYITNVSVLARVLAVCGTLSLVVGFLCMPSVSRADTLYRQLSTGMSGADVSALQTFLAQDRTIYPQGLITGYYGYLTQAAVSNFQSRNGIATAGRVGPATLPVLNLQMANGMGGSSNVNSTGAAPSIMNVSINSSRNDASINWITNEYAKGMVYYSANPLITYERENSVDVSGNTAQSDMNYRTSQNVSIQGLQSGTTYYYLIYTTDEQGNVSVTWPSSFQTSN